jgi:hypothetical protein
MEREEAVDYGIVSIEHIERRHWTTRVMRRPGAATIY